MYLQFSLDNSNLNSTPWALSEATFMKINPVSLKLPNYPIQSLQYIYNIPHIYIICISIILSIYYNSSEYENDDFFSNKSCVTKIALTTSWLHCSSPSKEEPLQNGGCSDLCWTQTLADTSGNYPSWLEDLHTSIDKKNLLKLHFSIAMWIYQTIAVGLSKSIVFVCDYHSLWDSFGFEKLPPQNVEILVENLNVSVWYSLFLLCIRALLRV